MTWAEAGLPHRMPQASLTLAPHCRTPCDYRLLTDQLSWVVCHGWDCTEMQRVVFLLTFQGQMEVLPVWPLFIWECRLDLVIPVDERLRCIHQRWRENPWEPPRLPSLLPCWPLVGSYFSLCFSHSLVLFPLFGFLFIFSEKCVMALGGI